MGTVFYLPGILGTALVYARPPQSQYWVDPDLLLKNFAADLFLDGTVGINPGPKAASLAPASPLYSHYGRALDALETRLKGSAFENVVPYGYDWRYAMSYSASFLASDIAKVATPTNPCVLVGHSMGGLIARLAYYQLRVASKGNLVKRIITIGTPHRGSARVFNALNGDFGEGYGYVFQSSILNLLPGGSLALKLAQNQILTMMATWPGFIELLPMIENDGSQADQSRKNAFLPASYSGGGTLFPALFDNAKNVTHPLLRDGTSIPPGKKLVCMVGTGYPTPYLAGPPNAGNEFAQAFLNQRVWIRTTNKGDGTVTEESATVPGAQVVRFDCSHSQLPFETAYWNPLSDLITESIDDMDVTPPPEQTPPAEQAAPYLAPPLVPPPPPDPPAQKARGWRGGRGRPVRQ